MLRRQPRPVSAVRRDRPPAHRRAAAPGTPRGGAASRRGRDGDPRRRPAGRVARAPARRSSTTTAASCSGSSPELGQYLPGEAYRQAEFGRESDSIFRALLGVLPGDRDPPADLPELRRPPVGRQGHTGPPPPPGSRPGRRPPGRIRRLDRRSPDGRSSARPAPAIRSSKRSCCRSAISGGSGRCTWAR